MAYEEPPFEVVASTDDYEIRRYESYLVAEVETEGSLRGSGNQAFRILAGYIFGDNRQQTKMEMTTPVESAPADGGVKMEMTIPVTSEPVGEGKEVYRYAFVMERKYTEETLPEPIDSRIRIRRIEPRTAAVLTFSGLVSASKVEKRERELLGLLQRDGIEVAGSPYLARYNGPFTLPFLRRNEIIVPIRYAE